MQKNLVKLALVALLFVFSYLSPDCCHAEGPKIWIENDGGLSRDHLTNGKIKVSQCFFGAYDLEELIQDNPTALALAEKQSQFNTYAHLSYWLGVIPSVGVFGYGLGSENTTVTIVSAVTLLGTALLTGHFVSESRHYMYEAINIYNGIKKPVSVSSNEEASKTPFSPSLATNTIGMSFHF